MTFGSTSGHIHYFSVEDITQEKFMILAIEAAKILDWNVGYISETGYIVFTRFSMSSWSEAFKVKIKDGMVTLKSECTNDQMTDPGKNKDNITNFISIFTDLKNTFTEEELAQKYEELKRNLFAEENTLKHPVSSTKEYFAGLFSIFKPSQGYFITPVIIYLNFAVFALMILSGVNAFFPDNASLIKWGANFRPVTLDGEWWRLITNCFLHIGGFHLLMNMYALIYVGLLLEPYLDKTRFAAAYLLTGISASIASLWWHDLTISAGASGAIFGMYGVFLILLMTNLIEKTERKTILISIVIFVVYNLIYGVKGGIDIAAHLGGLVSGLVIGTAYIPSLKKPGELKLKYNTVGMLSIIVLISSAVIYNQMPNDFVKYDQKMKEFVATEAKAINVYNLPDNSSDEIILAEIKRGIYFWNENIKLVTGLEQLDLPEKLHERNRKLLLYCDLQIKTFDLIYKGIEEDTTKYFPQIEAYNNQIESIIEELTGES